MNETSTITYLEKPELFYDRERLQRFLQGLAEQGYYVAGSDQAEVREARLALLNRDGEDEDAERLFSPIVSPVLGQDAIAFVEQALSDLSLTLFSTAREGEMQGVEIDMLLDAESAMVYSTLHGSSDVLEHYKRWLALHRYMYTVWHPLYSYNDSGGAIPYTSREKILVGKVKWLYEVNLFSPLLAEKLGRERLLNTPAWHVESLDDGSIFFVPVLTYNGGKEEDYAYSREEIASQLGLRANGFGEDEEE
jgi:hypothetical protein